LPHLKSGAPAQAMGAPSIWHARRRRTQISRPSVAAAEFAV